MKNGTITRRMDSVLNGLQSEFKSLCDISDFERKLATLKMAGTKSDRSSKLRKLFDMFDMCGILYEKGKDNAYYENLVHSSAIPTFFEIENRMLCALYKEYAKYPSPEDYMNRMVNRLCCPNDGWDNEPLRVRILKQFVKYGNYLEDADIKGKATVVKYVKEKMGLNHEPTQEEVCANVDEGVFRALNVQNGDIWEARNQIIAEIQKIASIEKEIDEMKEDLSELHEDDITIDILDRRETGTKKIVYSYRVNQNEIGIKEIEFKIDEKEKNIGDVEKEIEKLRSRIASLKSKEKDRRKALKRKVELLKIADDLANGKFRTGGATKKYLYLFAMVYGMTYYSGAMATDEIIDFKTDMEINLFRDYYTNNLMRFISEAYKGNLCEYDLDPSGQGINYKNFAEMIYLYYISKDYEPQEKIKYSYEMICRVQERCYQKGAVDTAKNSDRTIYYKNLFSEDLLLLDAKAFEKFICENYDCDTYKGNRKKGVLELEDEQATAFAVYQDVITELNKILTARGDTMDICNYGLWFTDVANFKKRGMEYAFEVCDKNDFDYVKFEEFIELLMGVNRFVGYTVDEKSSMQNKEQEHSEISKIKIKALDVSSKNKVSRTSIIVAYYYYYNALHENDSDEKQKSFEEVFNNFKKGIDSKLEVAFYQPLSGKNIFDVLVAFSSYAYLNI